MFQLIRSNFFSKTAITLSLCFIVGLFILVSGCQKPAEPTPVPTVEAPTEVPATTGPTGESGSTGESGFTGETGATTKPVTVEMVKEALAFADEKGTTDEEKYLNKYMAVCMLGE